MDSSKQSRRFACDRCRIYKLRCERVSAEGNSCRRCIKFGILCTTNNTPKTQTGRRRSAHTLMTPQSPANIQLSATPSQRIAPSPVGTQGSTVLGFDPGSSNTNIDDCPSDLMMLADFDFMDMMENQGSLHSSDEMTRSVSAFEGLPDSSNLAADMTALRDGQHRQKGTSCHRGLLELSANLVDEIDRLDALKNSQALSANPGFLEMTTQSALSQTSELIDILKKLAIEGEEDKDRNCARNCARNASTSQHLDGADSSSRHQDVLLSSALITSYVLITRYWQRLFSHINRLHVEEPSGPAKPLPALPALLLGGIQATANPDIQFMVLLETCSSMIQLIEAYLGVSSSCVTKFSETATETRTLLNHPISISMRETMLSIEVLHNARPDGARPLKDTMKSMEEVIFKRRWRI